jgi:hypothetical protein
MTVQDGATWSVVDPMVALPGQSSLASAECAPGPAATTATNSAACPEESPRTCEVFGTGAPSS